MQAKVVIVVLTVVVVVIVVVVVLLVAVVSGRGGVYNNKIVGTRNQKQSGQHNKDHYDYTPHSFETNNLKQMNRNYR